MGVGIYDEDEMSTKSYGEPGVPLHGVPCDRISWKVREYMNGAVADKTAIG